MYKIKCFNLMCGALVYLAVKVCLGHGALEILAGKVTQVNQNKTETTEK